MRRSLTRATMRSTSSAAGEAGGREGERREAKRVPFHAVLHNTGSVQAAGILSVRRPKPPRHAAKSGRSSIRAGRTASPSGAREREDAGGREARARALPDEVEQPLGVHAGGLGEADVDPAGLPRDGGDAEPFGPRAQARVLDQAADGGGGSPKRSAISRRVSSRAASSGARATFL